MSFVLICDIKFLISYVTFSMRKAIRKPLADISVIMENVFVAVMSFFTFLCKRDLLYVSVLHVFQVGLHSFFFEEF